MAASFTLGTWNILATAYIRRSYYPDTAPAILDPKRRIPALARRASELGVDILCLQEVEQPAFDAVSEALAPDGYAGTLALKGEGRPDGCATFFRTACSKLLAERRVVYSDGVNIAQVLTLEIGGTRLELINTHLKWDPPSTPRERQVGLQQARQAVEALEQDDPAGVQAICGDFNTTADSSVTELLTAAGFDYTHRGLPSPTCNSNRQAKMIDYIFFRGGVRAEPAPVTAINDLTPLPSAEEPSDHLPLTARFTLLD